ncbi:MAG TPA: molecular chaperone [Allosphingosinicella sp.]|nr:molecular chaperone [Allosphingosinicella sp.]
MMLRKTILGVAGALASLGGGASPARGASGDLLVAPTRIVLDGRRGAEVVLNNIGSEPATYRISLELRRMTAAGRLEPVDAPTAAETTALEMIAYAPRKVTLQPNQPQSVRVGVRPPERLADGEYRVHMLFRAIPDARAATAAPAASDGVAIALTPIYGVTIPVIVRSGQLAAQAAASDARPVMADGRKAISFKLARTGSRSLYGDVRLLKPGSGPILLARGIAVYPEVGQREVVLPVDPALTGAATVQYVERPEDGGRVLAETAVVLR